MNDTTTSIPLALRTRQGRLCAVQWIFQNKKFPEAQMSIEEIKSILHEEIGHTFKPDSVVLRKIIQQYKNSEEKIHELIKNHLPQTWSLERLDPVLASIISAATAEALCQKTPFKVILREYGDIAETFYEQKEIGFIHKVINGILTSLGYATQQGSAIETESH